MKVTNAVVTVEEANQNFSRVARLAEERGKVYVTENDKPKYLIIDLDVEPQIEMSEEEKFEFVTKRILREHIAAFRELAK